MPRKEVYHKYREQSIAAATKWNRENPGRRAAIHKKYKSSEKGRISAKRYKQARRAAHRKARVAWRDQGLIDSIYAEAELIGRTVDHIVPLRHPLVCGLHCEDNLMIVSARYNQKKNNTFKV